MSMTIQDFFATSTQKAADDLIKAFLSLPEDKRNWAPDEKARTAIDQMVECTLLNGYTGDVILSRIWTMNDMDAYTQEKKAAMDAGWENLEAVLQANTAKAIAAMRNTPSEYLTVDIAMPWGSKTLAEIIAYPYWNMSYHLGQINYLASILGCLK